MIQDNYQPDYDFDGPQLKPGEYEAVIERVIQTYTKADNKDMLKIDIKVQKKQFWIYIVDNEYLNKNLTRFFVCFGIKPGNWDYDSWRHKAGRVFIDRKPDSQYFEIKYLIAPEQGEQPRQNERPRQEPPRNDYRQPQGEQYRQPPQQSRPQQGGYQPRQEQNYRAPPQGNSGLDDIPF